MRAFILAAGLGTRLLPAASSIPKVLVPLLGLPLLERLVAYLCRGGVQELALNSHHRAEALAAHVADLNEKKAGGPPIRIFHEPELLGTGGGLLNAAPFWGSEPLLVWNGDIVAALEPALIHAAHAREGALATLATQKRETNSFLSVDEEGYVCGLDSPRRGERRLVRAPRGGLERRAFNGISVLAPELRAAMGERPGPFDLVDALLDAVASGAEVRAFDCGNNFWGTSGTREKLTELEARLSANPELLAGWTPRPRR